MRPEMRRNKGSRPNKPDRASRSEPERALAVRMLACGCSHGLLSLRSLAWNVLSDRLLSVAYYLGLAPLAGFRRPRSPNPFVQHHHAQASKCIAPPSLISGSVWCESNNSATDDVDVRRFLGEIVPTLKRRDDHRHCCADSDEQTNADSVMKSSGLGGTS